MTAYPRSAALIEVLEGLGLRPEPTRERGIIELADERDSALSPESNIMRTAPADPAISGEAGACAFIGDRR
jgi:hypothetical protein